jgi:hypothetical protein
VRGSEGRGARELLPEAADLLCRRAPEAARVLSTRVLLGLVEEMLQGRGRA